MNTEAFHRELEYLTNRRVTGEMSYQAWERAVDALQDWQASHPPERSDEAQSLPGE